MTSKPGSVRNASDPKAIRPTAVATTEARTTRPKERVSKFRRISSRAKKTPAIGALKVAAMPPAAPQATSSRVLSAAWRVSWPRPEPIAEPIWTIGPSRPTEPPAPIVIAEATDLTIGTRPRIRPSLEWTASITSGTPWPRASGAKRKTSGP